MGWFTAVNSMLYNALFAFYLCSAYTLQHGAAYGCSARASGNSAHVQGKRGGIRKSFVLHNRFTFTPEEINKSDTVAALLAIKAVQSMVSEMKEDGQIQGLVVIAAEGTLQILI